ncbi:N-formylglutamate amidohydrolase [Acidimangrovimonas pyrenivorans]|uniref:N-formylglutamate amidohydrolase n=1 Tax=Acidimangrovimonas pyrenivorans TaxID=2030798 RepID=A0ABV7AI25_9RHOB
MTPGELSPLPPLLAIDEPPAYGAVNPDGTAPLVLLCEHAALRIPRKLGDLGLSEAERRRHIGWDIGAMALALGLSDALDASLFHTNYSRLVVDCNRETGNPGQVPERSEATAVPGNIGLAPRARRQRIETLFSPFHAAVSRRLDRMQAQGLRPLVVGVHSFNPVYHEVARPWDVGVLYAGARDFAAGLMAGLRAQGPELTIGDNEPYRIDHDDYTVPFHGEARGLPAVLIEVRNDLIADHAGVALWTHRLAHCLRPLLPGHGVLP